MCFWHLQQKPSHTHPEGPNGRILLHFLRHQRPVELVSRRFPMYGFERRCPPHLAEVLLNPLRGPLHYIFFGEFIKPPEEPVANPIEGLKLSRRPPGRPRHGISPANGNRALSAAEAWRPLKVVGTRRGIHWPYHNAPQRRSEPFERFSGIGRA